MFPIQGEEKTFKLCRIEDKKTIKTGSIQLNMHDGKNILVPVKDIKRPVEDIYHTLDTVLVKLSDNKMVKHFKFTEGAYVVIINGGNLGREGKIREIISGTSTRSSLVSIEDQHGEIFQTKSNYIFVVGEEKPVIKLAAG